jgi:hypothetical protein
MILSLAKRRQSESQEIFLAQIRNFIEKSNFNKELKNPKK